MVECHHRIINELGMSMLFHYGTPLYLWVEAFAMVVFFINRLPSIALESNTLYFKLQGNHPNYSFLRVFGSNCFPYTWIHAKIIVIDIKAISAFIHLHKNYYFMSCSI